jgi:hypothetical protein
MYNRFSSHIILCFIMSLLFFSSTSMSKGFSKDIRWFVGTEIGLLFIDDTEGDVDTTFTPLGLVGGTYQIDRSSFVKGELFYLSSSVSGTPNSLGQNFSAYGLTAQYQKSYVFSHSIKPLFGLGLTVSNAKATERYLEDEYGYVAKTYEDDSSVGFGVVLSVSHDFLLYKESFSAGLKYTYGIDSMDLATVFLSYNF